jgi:hypothetical protein
MKGTYTYCDTFIPKNIIIYTKNLNKRNFRGREDTSISHYIKISDKHYLEVNLTDDEWKRFFSEVNDKGERWYKEPENFDTLGGILQEYFQEKWKGREDESGAIDLDV